MLLFAAPRQLGAACKQAHSAGSNPSEFARAVLFVEKVLTREARVEASRCVKIGSQPDLRQQWKMRNPISIDCGKFGRCEFAFD